MTSLHPTFQARDKALRSYCGDLGIVVGNVGVCRSLEAQIRLYAEKPHLAANPFAVGSVTPWGWRYRGSLHVEQIDGWCHAIDYTIRGCVWSQFHAIAATFGIGFPMKDRLKYPEPWHGQWFRGSTIYPAPAMPPAYPLPTFLEPDVKTAIRATGTDAIVLTDGHFQWHVTDGAAFREMCAIGAVRHNGRDASGNYLPYEVSEAFVEYLRLG